MYTLFGRPCQGKFSGFDSRSSRYLSACFPSCLPACLLAYLCIITVIRARKVEAFPLTGKRRDDPAGWIALLPTIPLHDGQRLTALLPNKEVKDLPVDDPRLREDQVVAGARDDLRLDLGRHGVEAPDGFPGGVKLLVLPNEKKCRDLEAS